LGHVTDQTPGDIEKMSLGIRKADPDVKASAEIQDILAESFVATEPIPAEVYKLPPPPGSTDVK
jgi:hypothetical protein